MPEYTRPLIGPISDDFREHLAGGRTAGCDYVVPIGTPVRAIKGGVSTIATRAGGTAGVYIEIDHGLEYSRYLHLSNLRVKKGEVVIQGQVIGTSGNSGQSTGPHLHHDIRFKERLPALQVYHTPVPWPSPRGWLVDPEVLFSLKEDDELQNYIILQRTDNGQYYIYDPIQDAARELSAPGFKALKAAEAEGDITLTGVAMSAGEIAGINKQ